ncbi:transcriptional regulator [Alteribacter lacisalsi]|uniref:Transcriptional regulator n=1 Tax=Alteribacter lacisalsi TaxID=2045244 RepID=A0A2W0HGE0_9BACI|nr:DeoR/GlpR family DNA-binding transcription regulator [Alteribacter lacisalsi]PYZ95952.1 transcriptional regulator [Alteribacter lacisalsi]
MLPLERRAWIEQMVLEQGKIDIENASKSLEVSAMTIRRDLRELEQEGKVVRTHGGAISSQSLTKEANYAAKESQNKKQKQEIALRAAAMVEDHSTIILDSGTTTFELAKQLSYRENLTIVTNDIKIASELMGSKNKVIVTGGEMQMETGSLLGTATQQLLKAIHADVFFLGAHAVDYNHGVSAPTFEKALIKQMMKQAAQTTWLLADHSKFGKRAFASVCRLEEIGGVITDSQVPEAARSSYENKVQVLCGGV